MSRSEWQLSSSSDPRALGVVDGTCCGEAPHYSRRTPGSKTFTGVGQEVVLVTEDNLAVWAVVYQRTPTARGTGNSRGREGASDQRPKYVFRNMLFRNLGPGLSSDLIRSATDLTFALWAKRYGVIPPERLRTEIGVAQVRSTNPGYSYMMAGWTKGERRRGKLFLYAPEAPR